MTEKARGDTRERLLEAAAELIAASPGEEISLRAVCERVGVRMPTLYHFFGSKEGLLDAVVEHGFELYLSAKAAHESSGDPIQDLRDGWDAHVAFGLANPGFYTLMYGQVRPGDVRPALARPTQMLRELTGAAEQQGRLAVSADQAAAHILATNIGVTLRQIILAAPDPELTAAARDAVIAGITGVHSDDASKRAALLTALDYAVSRPDVLGEAETALLASWLRRLADAE
ncbi:TetR/AcrR family transcriptional regulator [Gordonia hydrophobica]|uniref:TetR/AcrR family transcriptional regulator n=1 Tax=Gordonia hydrophobica TaxID=40516 RepID=A0ABZ2TWG8_9ACTN|nr:TetR/AcrR family transcriptional regulator [Gordonia hydrophobica]MBM7365760.1 AcrR family transcriptional regulator [Gordonia hydrophobica]